MTAFFQYRCRYCGCMFKGAATDANRAPMELGRALSDKNAPLHQTDVHVCCPGHVGVGDLVGYLVEP